jgi:hypothetical protein
LSKTIENATSSPSVATDNSDCSSVDLDDAETGPARAFNPSKKRKADAVDDPGSDSELPAGKRKSKEEVKKRKRSKKKAKDEDKEHMRN